MDSLDPELRRVVHDGMRQALPDAHTEARVLASLLTRLPDAGPGDARGDGGDGGDLGPVDPSPTLASSTGLGVTVKAIVGATIVAAAVVGGLAIARREPRSPQTPTTPTNAEASAPASEPAIPSAPAPSEARPPAPAVVATPPIADPLPPAVREPRRPTPSPTTAVPRADDLASEARILADAEAALARGDVDAALAHAAAHAEHHPGGQLAVEREAIQAAASCLAGHDGAHVKAEAFYREHPRSPAAAKVRARCEGLGEKRGAD